MSFESRLFPKGKEDAQRFHKACASVFNTPEGKTVLGMLCNAAHPLKHTAGMSEHDHGQAEVVAALWRFSNSDKTELVTSHEVQS